MAGNYLFIYLDYESQTDESYLIIVNESEIRK